MKAIFTIAFLAGLVAGNDLQGVTITGQLVDARTFQPLRGAVVRAVRVPVDKPDASPNIGFRTGADGKFVLRGVAPGIVHFSVAKAGYVAGPYPSARPAIPGETIDNVVLTVLPGASISGRVVDESGQPVAGALVTTGTPSQLETRGQRIFSSSSVATLTGRTLVSQSVATVTDDDGQYWLGGLAAGDYVVTVNPYGEVGVAQDPMDRPGAQNLAVKVDVGEDRAGADLVVKLRPSNLSAPAVNARGTNVVSGRVVDTRGRGISNAIVLMSPADPSRGFNSTTDSAGNFQISDVPAGTFGIGARAPGFPMGLQLRSQPSLTPVEIVVTAGSRTDNVVLTLRKGAVISGTVTDEFGDPVWAAVTIAGPYSSEVGPSARTVTADARGRYRLVDLTPGEYLVSVQAPKTSEVHFQDGAGHDRVLATAPVFYPGVPRASLATRITVAEGEESAGINLVLEPVSVANINVTVTAGRPVSDVQLNYIALDDRMAIQNTTTVKGSATTLDVAPGRYRLLASADVATDADNVSRLWSLVEVDADPLLPATVTMNLEPAANLSGRIVFEGAKDTSRQGAGPSLLAVARVSGTRWGFSPGGATYDVATGTFSIRGVVPGQYVLQAGVGDRGRTSPWILKAATIGGRDVLEQPIDLNPGMEIDDVVLTVTDRIGELSGRIIGAGGRPASSDWVVIFSTDSKHWYQGSRRTRVTRPDDKGTYTVRALLAGSYIVALSSTFLSQDDDLQQTLQTLATSGVRVTLAEGEKRVQDLRRR
jgi:protocatechuate 3,4-dioxygenase beta subunit